MPLMMIHPISRLILAVTTFKRANIFLRAETIHVFSALDSFPGSSYLLISC